MSSCSDTGFGGMPNGGGCAEAFIILMGLTLAFGGWGISKMFDASKSKKLAKAKTEKTIDTIAKTNNDSTLFMKSLVLNNKHPR